MLKSRKSWLATPSPDSAKTAFPILYNKVKAVLCIDINQERIKNACKIAIFLGKVLVVQKKVVPLHPQIRNTTWWAPKERVLWKIYIDRSSTRSECFSEHLGRLNEPFDSWILDSRSETDNTESSSTSFTSETSSRDTNFTMKSLILAQDER